MRTFLFLVLVLLATALFLGCATTRPIPSVQDAQGQSGLDEANHKAMLIEAARLQGLSAEADTACKKANLINLVSNDDAASEAWQRCIRLTCERDGICPEPPPAN